MRATMHAARAMVLLAACLFAGWATAQGAYPVKPIKFILPFGPGSGTDVVARIAGDEMASILKQPVVIEHRAGASGFIAAEMAAKSPPDGYTLFVTSGTTQSLNPSLFKKLPYDPVKDFEPVGGLIQAYYVLIVNKDFPANTLAELIAWLKANPGKASYGWGAAVSQVTGSAFLARIGATATGVAYKSSPQSVNDLIGGLYSFTFLDLTTALGHIRAGRVKAIAVTSPQRNPSLPEVPTMSEAGLPGFTSSTFIGLFAPASVPEPIIARVNGALQQALRNPAVSQRLIDCCSAAVHPISPADYKEYLKADRKVWAERIAAAGIQPE